MTRAALLLLCLASGCTPNDARPAAYGAELEECNRTAATLEESITCENKVRTRYGRPLRDARDAGGD